MVVHWRAAPGLADRRPQVQALQFALENMSKIMVVVKVSVMVKGVFEGCRSLVVGDGRCRSRSRLW